MSHINKILTCLLSLLCPLLMVGQTAQNSHSTWSDNVDASAAPLLTKIIVIRGSSAGQPDWWTNRCQVGTLDLESIRGVMNDLGLIVLAGPRPTPSSYRETSKDYPLLADLNKLWVDPIEYAPESLPELIEELNRAISVAKTENERIALNQFLVFAQEQQRNGHGLVLL